MGYHISSGEISTGTILENNEMHISKGGVQFVPPIAAVQYVYLDFDGELTSYRGEILTVENVEVQHSELSEERIKNILTELNKKYAAENIIFVTEIPPVEEYSTIYIGKTEAFEPYGSFAGLAETLDENNQIKTDKAFVMLNATNSNEEIINTISHETDHITGKLNHGGEGINAYALVVISTQVVNNLVLNDSSLYVSYGGFANNTTINYRGSAYIYQGGIANSTIINSYGSIRIYENGFASKTTVNFGGYMDIRSGGAKADDIIVKSGGRLLVSGGGSATNIIAEAGAKLNLDVILGTYIQGEYAGSKFEIKDAVVSNFTISGDGVLGISSGATAKSIHLNDGNLHIYKNGEAYNTSNTGGIIYVRGGIAYETFVNSGSIMEVYNYGIASNITLTEGHLRCYYGGVIYNAIVNSMGIMHNSSGGTAHDIVVCSGGSAFFHSGATLRGRNSFAGSVVMSGTANAAGATLNFAVDQRKTTDDYIIDNLALITGTPTYTVTVSANQTTGTYKLAQGASSFTGTISIGNGTTDYGSITVNGSALTYGGKSYSLVQSSGNLTLNIASSASVATNVKIYSSGTLTSQGSSIASTVLSSGGNDSMHVSSGGVANDTTVNKYSEMHISSGGVANDTTVNKYSEMHISSGGVANSTTVNSKGEMYIYSGGAANGTTVYSNGYIVILSGGRASNTVLSGVLSSGGNMFIYIGGEANNNTVNAGGDMSISSGGVANNTTVNAYGYIYIENNGIANSTTVNSLGHMVIRGGVVNSAIIKSEAFMDIYGNGSANNITVQSGGYISTANSNTITDLTVNAGGDLCGFSFNEDKYFSQIKNGSAVISSNVIIINNSMSVKSGGVANCVSINFDGSMYISSGGVANSTSITSNGQMYIQNGGAASRTSVFAGYVYVQNGGRVNSTTLDYSGDMHIQNGGGVSNTTVNYSGSMFLSSGGVASNTTVNSMGSMFISSGAVASNTTVNSMGSMFISSGGVANSTTVNFSGYMYIEDGGVANSTTVNSSGYVFISSGGVANSITVNSYGRMYISSGGEANSTTVNGGYLYISSGGEANNTTVNSGGSARLSSGATLKGRNTLAGTVIMAGTANAAGATLNFAVDQCKTTDSYIIDNLSLISGTPTYTITVSASQDVGTYKLAQDASSFTGTITIGNGSTDYGTLTVNGSALTYGGKNYSLVQSSGNLTLNIASPASVAANVKIYSSGTLTSQGSSIAGAVLSRWGNDSMHVSSGGVANSTTVNSSGRMNISSGGVASNTTVNAMGSMFISSGAVAIRTTVNSFGKIYISGTANSTTLGGSFSFASMYIYNGGVANNTIVNQGIMHVSNGGVANSTTVNAQGYLGLVSGGIANSTTVNSAAWLEVAFNGSVSNTTVNSGGSMNISSGGVANSTTVNHGYMSITRGGVANSTTVNSSGTMIISSGGVANDTTVNSWGDMYISSGGSANNISAGYYAGIDIYGNVNGIFASRTGFFNVYSGGKVSSAVISHGYVYASSGGYVYNATIKNYGTLSVEQGGSAVTATIESNGRLRIESGAYLNNVNVLSGGNINGFQVKSSVAMNTTDGSFTLNNVVINSSWSGNVYENQTINNVTVSFGGCIKLWGGTLKNVSLHSGGELMVYSNSVLTGINSFAGNVYMSSTLIASGATINFAVDQLNTTDGYIIDNLSLISGAPTYTITVSVTQETGVYKLAAGADEFNQTISVKNTSGTNYGTLTVGQSFTYSDKTYSLALDNSDGLVLQIGDKTANYADLTFHKYSSWSDSVLIATEPQADSNASVIYDNQNVYLSVGVGNAGTSDAAANLSYVYLDGLLVKIMGYGSYTGLEPDQALYWEMDLGKISAGDHTLKIVIDEDNEVPESNENNNIREISFTVKTAADTTAPMISNVSIAQGANNYTFTATITASDNKTAANDLTYQIKYAATQSGLTGATAVSGKSFTISNTAAGKTYYYQVGVTDEAGNTAWSTAKSFYIGDKTLPVLNGTPNATYADNSIAFTWNAASDNVGVAGYHLTVNGKVYDVKGTSYTLSGVSAGTYTYQLSAYDATGNETAKTAGKSLVVESRPDLIVNSIKVLKDGSPVTTVSTEDKITVYINVKNIGDATSTANTVKVYCGEVLLKEVSLASIAKNATAVCTCTIEAGSMSTGVQDIYVQLDAKGTVTEYNEGNNEAHFSLLVENRELCDLVVGSIELDKTACSISESAKVTFTIKNIGHVTAGATKAYIYDGDTYLGSVNVASLAAGATSAKLSYTIPAGTLSAGSHSIRVVADGEGLALESNTNNNSASAALTVGGVDLSVSKLNLSKTSCNTGENLTVNFTIRNSGIDKSGSFKVGIYDGNTLLGTVDIANLDAGLSVAKTFVISAGKLSAGTHNIRVSADINNTVSEIDETNNSRSTSVNVSLLDTTAPTFKSTTITQGSENYTFTVNASATDNATAADQLVYKIRYAKTQAGLASAQAQSSMSFNLTADDAGDTWYYQVSATDKAGNTAWSAAKSFTVADKTDPVFGNISVTTTNMTLKLTWSATDNVGISTYKVYFDDELKATQATTSYTLSNVAEGVHTYRIEAFDAAGNMVSTGNTSVRFDDMIAPVIDNISIAQLQGTYKFIITPNASDNITSTSNLTYKVQYALTQSGVASATAVSGLQFTLDAANAGKPVYYRINVADEAGNSVWSDIKSINVADVTNPGNVSGLKETINGTSVTLDWADSTDNVGVTGYYLRYGKSQTLTGNGTKVTASQQTLSNLSAGKYYWQLRAVDAAGNLGEWSTVDNFTIFPADPYENNSTAATAYNLGTLNGEKTYTGGAIASGSDADYFKFTIDSRGTANDYVQISFNNFVGDVDLYLYAANGSTLIKSANTSTSGTEKISLEGLTKGTYIIKAVGKNGAMNTYTLSTKKVAGYDPDIYDANSNNNTRTAATVFNIETTPQKTISNLNLHEAGDVDFYQFTLSNMGVTGDNVTINFQNSVGDLDLFLYNGAGSLVQKSEGNGNSETLNFGGLAAGTYYVQVKSPYDHVNEYSLSWKFTPNKVAADKYEGKEPIAITETTEIKNLTISAADTGVTQQDTFKITLAAAGNNSSKITFSDFRCDWNGLKYTVKNSSNTTVLSGTGAEISLNGLAAGNYTVTVDTPVAGSYGEYSISVNMPEEDAKTHAVLVYAGGDNNGHNRYLYDIVTMQQSVLQAGVDVYVLLDRSSNPADQQNCYFVDNNGKQLFPDWTDTRVAKISYSTSNKPEMSWITWGEMNTGDISTLEKFIDWGQDQAQADSYTLVVKDHGYYAGNVCSDHSNNGDNLWATEVSTLISQYDNIGVTVFDACLMGSESVITAMSGSCDYVVASEANSYSMNQNIQWDVLLESITADMSSEEIAKAFVSSVNLTNKTTGNRTPHYNFNDERYYAGFNGGVPHTLAAYDVSENYLANALNAFGAASSEFTNNDWHILVNAFAMADFYAGDSKNPRYYSDLRLILNSIKGGSFTLNSAVETLLQDIDDFVIADIAYPSDFGSSFSVFNPILSSSDSVYRYVDGYGYGKDSYGNFVYIRDRSLEDWATFIQKMDSQRGYADSIQMGDNFSDSFSSITETVIADIGIFSGAGIVFQNMNVLQENFYSIEIPAESLENAKITVCSTTGNEKFTISLYNEDMSLLLSSEESLSLAGIEGKAGNYYIGINSETPASFTMKFEADWTTGVDRLDWEQTKVNEKYANGNGSASKATNLEAGSYSGLVTYKGDSDWYRIYTEDYSKNIVTVTGDNITVGEYDAAGNCIQLADYTEGIYTLNNVDAWNFIVVEGTSLIDNNEVDVYSIAISTQSNALAVVPFDLQLTVDANKVSWVSAADSFNAELSKDGFASSLALSVETTSISTYGMSSGNYQWRVQPDGSSEWTASESFAAASNTQPQKYVASADDSTDVFFANAKGKWSSGYAAQHTGILEYWSGTNEQVTLTGKNKLADIFEGSSDANILLLTDDVNGDALFVDDIYTALPGTVAEQQARIAKIDEIRAGNGDDIVDMTSQRFAYIGGGVTVFGGSGDDVIWANSGENTLFGDAGNDRIVGASGNDWIIGGSGDDYMHGGGGSDTFCFGGDWGNDTVEQLVDGSVTLWFESGSGNWDESTLTYTVGENSVTVSGVTADKIELKFGGIDDAPEGAFAEFASEKIFEDKKSGSLA